MAKNKYDGVVEAVHYKSEGLVEWVRVYLRHGVTFSDHVIVQRAEFISLLKKGQEFVVGERTLYLGGTFETSQPVKLVTNDGHELLVTENHSSLQDDLSGVPII